MDHLSYYGLSQEPFSIVPHTKFYYHNEQHDRAHMYLMRAIEGMKGLAVLVGGIGAGKSLLARRILENLPEERFEVALLVVLHSDVDSHWLIRRIAEQFGVETGNLSKVDIIGKLYAKLYHIAEEGRRAAILIDEAHMLRGQDLLEELRGLLNLELPDRKLISFVLFGMPELDDVLAREPALNQRTAVRYELKPFSADMTADYIQFRLFHAGTEQEIFSEEALLKIWKYSQGVPRLINVICDNALFEGFVRKSPLPIPQEIIDSVAEDLRLK
ncbi:MAG: AAA family ATPase [Deltaproteobacteria bacterium]|nr:AAA family ATPase [Deltaproteobacteria bacterium]